MMKRETFAIANIYVPVKRRATLDSKKAQEIAESILWTEPVVSSLFGARFSPMLIFRRPNTPHTRVATHRMLSAIRPPEISHGTAESCRIAETTPVSKRADQAPPNIGSMRILQRYGLIDC